MSQNENNKPHFTYYDDNRDLSFVWDGENPFIEVCPNGYGEPAEYSIWHVHGPNPQVADTPLKWLKWFESTCLEWTHPDDEEEEEEEEEETEYSFTQPICDNCWMVKEGSRVPTRLIGSSAELCVMCANNTNSGIYIRIDLSEARYPSLTK